MKIRLASYVGIIQIRYGVKRQRVEEILSAAWHNARSTPAFYLFYSTISPVSMAASIGQRMESPPTGWLLIRQIEKNISKPAKDPQETSKNAKTVK